MVAGRGSQVAGPDLRLAGEAEAEREARLDAERVEVAVAEEDALAVGDLHRAPAVRRRVVAVAPGPRRRELAGGRDAAREDVRHGVARGLAEEARDEHGLHGILVEPRRVDDAAHVEQDDDGVEVRAGELEQLLLLPVQVDRVVAAVAAGSGLAAGGEVDRLAAVAADDDEAGQVAAAGDELRELVVLRGGLGEAVGPLPPVSVHALEALLLREDAAAVEVGDGLEEADAGVREALVVLDRALREHVARAEAHAVAEVAGDAHQDDILALGERERAPFVLEEDDAAGGGLAGDGDFFGAGLHFGWRVTRLNGRGGVPCDGREYTRPPRSAATAFSPSARGARLARAGRIG